MSKKVMRLTHQSQPSLNQVSPPSLTQVSVDMNEGDTSHTQVSHTSLNQVSPGVSPTPTVDVNEGDTSHTSGTQVSTKSPPSLHQVSPPSLAHPNCLSPPSVARICRPHLSHASCRPHLSNASVARICRMHHTRHVLFSLTRRALLCRLLARPWRRTRVRERRLTLVQSRRSRRQR